MSQVKAVVTQSVTFSDDSGLFARFETRSGVEYQSDHFNGMNNTFNTEVFKELADAFKLIKDFQ